MKIKVSELTGHQLDWMAGKAAGLEFDVGMVCCGNGVGSPPECCCEPILVPFWKGSQHQYQPSAEPQDVEPLRDIVRAKFGDVVDYPDDLL